MPRPIPVRPREGWTVRLGQFMVRHVINVADYDREGHRLYFTFPRARKLLTWLVLLPGRIGGFVRVVTGGKVHDSVYRNRMADCLTCPSMVPQHRSGATELSMYCGSCNCPNWFMSELSCKNRYKRHRCPMGVHSGSTPWAAADERRMVAFKAKHAPPGDDSKKDDNL